VTTARPKSTKTIAADIWQRLFGFVMLTRPQRDQVLERLGLTPNDARALGTLDQDEAHPMRGLADQWGCDASNATWMVDRLERRGLAERRTIPTDRRVKLVVLTPLGAKTKADLIEGMTRPPPELLALDREDLDALLTALEKLPAPGRNNW
jgi:DNA-binding MarR family transcriptional regulator